MVMLCRYGPELRPPKTSVLLARLPLRTPAPGLDGLTPDCPRLRRDWMGLPCPHLRRDWMGSPSAPVPRLSTRGALEVLTGVVRMEYSQSSQGYYGVLTGRVLSRWIAEGSAAARRQRCDVGARVFALSTLCVPHEYPVCIP